MHKYHAACYPKKCKHASAPVTTIWQHPQGGRLQPVRMQPPPPPPSYLSKLAGGGGGGGLGGQLGGGRLEGVGGGGPKVVGLRATHYYHMHTSRGDVCLGRVWGSCWWLL